MPCERAATRRNGKESISADAFSFFFPFLGILSYICISLFTNENKVAKEQANILERQRIQIKEPRRYTVTIHNDDFTTMDFVVKVLKEVFFMEEQQAMILMLEVHHKGKSVVGIYTYDIATSKVRKATEMARENGFPLTLTVVPENP